MFEVFDEFFQFGDTLCVISLYFSDFVCLCKELTLKYCRSCSYFFRILLAFLHVLFQKVAKGDCLSQPNFELLFSCFELQIEKFVLSLEFSYLRFEF